MQTGPAETSRRRAGNRAMQAECIVYCDPSDLERFRRGEPLQGVIKPGDILIWEPDNRQVCDVIEIIAGRPANLRESSSFMTTRDGNLVSITMLPPGDEMGFEMRGARWSSLKTCWNDEDRIREACVRAIIKCVPDWSRRDGGIE